MDGTEERRNGRCGVGRETEGRKASIAGYMPSANVDSHDKCLDRRTPLCPPRSSQASVTPSSYIIWSGPDHALLSFLPLTYILSSAQRIYPSSATYSQPRLVFPQVLALEEEEEAPAKYPRYFTYVCIPAQAY